MAGLLWSKQFYNYPVSAWMEEQVLPPDCQREWGAKLELFFSRVPMDLTIPYTFYPAALPHWIAWVLFLAAVFAGAVAGVVRGVERGWRTGLRAGLIGGAGFLAVTMVASMVITFLIHDQ